MPRDIVWGGVPVSAPMSSPSWCLPHRQANPEVIAPVRMARTHRLPSSAASLRSAAALARTFFCAAILRARASSRAAALRFAARTARWWASTRPSAAEACRLPS